MSLKQDLKDALALIEDPDHWSQGEMAATSSGLTLLDGNDPRADCWCALGATEKVCYKHGQSTLEDNDRQGRMISALDDAAQNLFPRDDDGSGDIVWVNDIVGHWAVVEVFQRAIEDSPDDSVR